MHHDGYTNVAYMPIDLANPEQNHFSPGFTDQEREGFGRLLSKGFTDSFRYLHPDEVKYSWWSQRVKTARTNNAGWRIDYFLVSDFVKDKIIEADMIDGIMRPDHCPIKLVIDI